MRAHGGLRRQKRADLPRRVGREIVDDDVDRSPARLRVDDRLQEGHELVARMPRHCVADDFAGVGVERRIPASCLATRLKLLRNTLRPTPHVQLAMKGMNLFAKLEYVNPVGSIKDRAAYWILTRAARAR